VISETWRDSGHVHVGRFAPSTTGEAHPGTLLAALLAWLDIRARGGRFVVLLTASVFRCDLTVDRSRPLAA
jgi:glutamyl-tRNA synthetase/glutamyl-Q tRNA(Asp) synthetase